jgi:hypothetical protein
MLSSIHIAMADEESRIGLTHIVGIRSTAAHSCFEEGTIIKRQ